MKQIVYVIYKGEMNIKKLIKVFNKETGLDVYKNMKLINLGK